MKKKIQLVRCPIDDPTIAADQWNMPLDLLLVADAVDRRCEVEILDGTALGSQVFERLSEIRPDVVGLTYTALSSCWLKKLAAQCKELGSMVIVGGQPATGAWRSLVMESNIDAVCIGDGQPTINVLSRQLTEGSIDLRRVPNLAFHDEKGLVCTDLVPENVWDQKMPPRDFAGVNPQQYIAKYPETNTLINMSGRRAGNLFSKRGCKRRCSFCARQDKNLRARNPAIVAKEIKYLVDEFGVDYILDTSDTWLDGVSESWTETFHMQRQIFGIEDVNLMVFADVRDISNATASALKACGVNSVLLGIESGSERILRRNGKSFSQREIIRAVDDLVSANIKVSCSFVLGLLGEDEESLEETISLTRKLHSKPGVLCYGNTIMPLMGSWLWASAFPADRPWPSFVTRALDYDLEQVRNLFVAEATSLPEGIKTLHKACEEILGSSQLPVKEYAR
jgi:radical SAM superfamily enzyme YgiQ (UPF0313 family)